jgi:hypothetical protein
MAFKLFIYRMFVLSHIIMDIGGFVVRWKIITKNIKYHWWLYKLRTNYVLEEGIFLMKSCKLDSSNKLNASAYFFGTLVAIKNELAHKVAI